MTIVRGFIKSDLQQLHDNDVRLKFLGKRQGIDDDILTSIDSAESLTKNNQGLRLAIAFNYGARDEICRAAQALADSGAGIAQEKMEAALAPAVDLLVRTGGEHRLSDFLLWQSAYAELIFVEAFWPDFTPKLFLETLKEYQMRQRRFGADETSPQENNRQHKGRA